MAVTTSGPAAATTLSAAHPSAADPLVERMRPFGTTIFAEMSAIAVRTGAVNLGQGFPDTDGPSEMLDAAAGPDVVTATRLVPDSYGSRSAPVGRKPGRNGRICTGLDR